MNAKQIIHGGFTIADLATDKYLEKLPELYALRGVVEKNDWHDNESVFDHTLAVLKEVDLLLELKWITNSYVKSEWRNYVREIVEVCSRQEILRIAALTHDFAKYETITRDSSGVTRCPNHEMKSADYILSQAEKFGLGSKDVALCYGLIKYHAEPDRVHNSTINSSRQERGQAIRVLYDETKTFWRELLVLALADTLGNQLAKSRPQRYHSQVDFLLRCLCGATTWDFEI